MIPDSFMFWSDNGVCKSYILRQVIESLIDNEPGVRPEQTLYINKEFSEFDFIRNHIVLTEFVRAYTDQLDDNQPLYLFIDEVQGIESWKNGQCLFAGLHPHYLHLLLQDLMRSYYPANWSLTSREAMFLF